MKQGVRAFVALGSNLGDRRAHLVRALEGLARSPGVRLAAVSAAFENPPVGGPPQDDYWNAVAEVRTTLAPRALHALLRGLEDKAGRVRTERDGPRTLDLDLLSHDGVVSHDEGLVLPHPRALERAFTLGPWCDIAPQAVVPGTNATVLVHAARLRRLEPTAFRALRRVALLDPAVRPGSAPPPALLRDRAELARWRDSVDGTVGFVPTLGALHEGHASHVRRAHAECDAVIASVFVNPTQFGPKEDFARYPRTLDADLALLASAGADAVYAPEVSDVYAPGHATSIDVEGPAAGFEGAVRPGHFRGVATVVEKLVVRVRPDRTYFGRKDAQQVAVVRRMALDLDLPGEIVVGPTVRDVDGLALSSRNRYLLPAERGRALWLPRALDAARESAAIGDRDTERIASAARSLLEGPGGLVVDYVAAVDPDTFERVPRLGEKPALIVAAVRSGTTRLLDNEWLVVGDDGPPR